jgi:hypothetical protein
MRRLRHDSGSIDHHQIVRKGGANSWLRHSGVHAHHKQDGTGRPYNGRFFGPFTQQFTLGSTAPQLPSGKHAKTVISQAVLAT